MECTRGAGIIRSKDKFADFQLHLEFATPSPPRGTGQGRGNSGVLINGMYEVQVLDSYQDKTYPDGQCGELYGQTPPLANACMPPGEWQTYDIIFESPRWDENGTLTKRTNVTVIQNGVVLHHKREFIGATDGIGGVPHTALGAYLRPHPPEVSIELQDHGNPVRYRNIWIRAWATMINHKSRGQFHLSRDRIQILISNVQCECYEFHASQNCFRNIHSLCDICKCRGTRPKLLHFSVLRSVEHGGGRTHRKSATEL